MNNEAKQIFIKQRCPDCKEQLTEKRIFEDDTAKIKSDCKECGFEYIGVFLPELLTTDQVAKQFRRGVEHVRNIWGHPGKGFLQTVRIPGAQHFWIEATEVARAIRDGQTPKRKRRRKPKV